MDKQFRKTLVIKSQGRRDRSLGKAGLSFRALLARCGGSADIPSPAMGSTLVPPSPPGREQRQTLNPITDNEPCLAATALLPAARNCPWAAPTHPLAALPPGVLYRGLPEKLWLAEPCLASLFCLLLAPKMHQRTCTAPSIRNWGMWARDRGSISARGGCSCPGLLSGKANSHQMLPPLQQDRLWEWFELNV